MYLDAREINKRMCNNHDQPPTIDEVFRRIGDKSFYSTLDMAKAVQILANPIDERQ